jgi:hypothetical protein
MSSSTHDLSAIFDEHVAHEFVAKDVAATMATMTAEPFVNHLPTMMGGVGADEVGLPVGTDWAPRQSVAARQRRCLGPQGAGQGLAGEYAAAR